MKEYLLNCIDRTFDDEDYYKINKYIEGLEEKIDKAIEYCNTYTRLSAKDLLEILNKEVK